MCILSIVATINISNFIRILKNVTCPPRISLSVLVLLQEDSSLSNPTMIFKMVMIKIGVTTYTGCPNKLGNLVTNSISSMLWISLVIPYFKSHNIIMSARVYLIKKVNGCKDVSKMSEQDEQWRRTSLFWLYTLIFMFY